MSWFEVLSWFESCPHHTPNAGGAIASELHGVCIFCWRDKAARYRRDLLRYGVHHAGCPKGQAMKHPGAQMDFSVQLPECICGLDQAVKGEI